MKSLLAFSTGLTLATAGLSSDPAIQCIASFLALYAGFTWARFDKLEGCGWSCGQGRMACSCRELQSTEGK